MMFLDAVAPGYELAIATPRCRAHSPGSLENPGKQYISSIIKRGPVPVGPFIIS